MVNWNVLYSLVVTLFCATRVAGLQCLQCSTMIDDSDVCESGQLSPTECGQNFTACLKYEGKTKSFNFIFRGCDREVDSRACRQTEIAGEKVQTCYYRCFSDGCNTVSSPHIKSKHFYFLIFSLWIFGFYLSSLY